MNKNSYFKGEKYIYYLMAYKLARANGGSISIGKDNGYTGGQFYQRSFKIIKYNGQILLSERKTSSCFADFTRTIEIIGESEKPTIKRYINEDNEDCYAHWTH